MNEFLVFKDSDGEYRPLVFISRNDTAGKLRAETYSLRLENGESIVLVELIEK